MVAVHVGAEEAEGDIRRLIARERVEFELLTVSDRQAAQLEEQGASLPFVMGVVDHHVLAYETYGSRAAPAEIKSFLDLHLDGESD